MNDWLELEDKYKQPIHIACRKCGVLIEEFKVKVANIVRSLVKFFRVPYKPYRSDKFKSEDLFKNLRREYLESSHWVPVDDTPEGLVILTADPERIRASWVVNNFFPNHKLIYKICTQNEFESALDMIYGDKSVNGLTGELTEDANMMNYLPNFMLDDDNIINEYDQYYLSEVADNELVKLVNKIIVDAYNLNATDIYVEPDQGNRKVHVSICRNGSMFKNIDMSFHLRNPLVTRLKIMSDLDISDHSKPQHGLIKFNQFGPLDIELKVVTAPLKDGMEKVVMHILADGEPIYLAPVIRIY